MVGKREPSDSRLNVARYQVERLIPEDERQAAESSGAEAQDDTNTAGQSMMEQRAQYVEMSIQQAIRRGEFDNLPGAGKPLKGLHEAYNPDWWIRQKIERERITGLGPPALTLRTENAELEGRLDKAPSEDAVRGILEDFNKRIVTARRQLQGGPPVVTPTRDVDAEVAAWRGRRVARNREFEERRAAEEATLAAMTWRERRRARREQGS